MVKSVTKEMSVKLQALQTIGTSLSWEITKGNLIKEDHEG